MLIRATTKTLAFAPELKAHRLDIAAQKTKSPWFVCPWSFPTNPGPETQKTKNPATSWAAGLKMAGWTGLEPTAAEIGKAFV